jgi:sigma-B regulation protein RsbU (phosphoserine phosphatase)
VSEGASSAAVGASGPNATALEELWRLAGQSASEPKYLSRLLELSAAAEGASGAAAYGDREAGALQLLGATSGAVFPTRLTTREGGAIKGLEEGFALKVPGGAVAFAGTAQPPAPSLALQLVASHLRGLKDRQEIKQQRFEVNYRVVELEALYEVGLAIAATLDLETLSEVILLRAVSLLDARRGALFLLRDGAFHQLRTVGGNAVDRVAADDPRLAMLLTGTPGPAGFEPLLPGALRQLAVPIEIDGETRGLLLVGDKETRAGVGDFALSDRRTLGLFANQAAIALENARLHLEALEKQRMEREMELAADIQRRLLPKGVPDVPGYEVYGWNRSARQVGGDYYDYLPRRGGREDADVAARFGFTIGDVSGKGVPAALLVSTLHSSLRLLADHVETGPDFLARVNQHLVDSSAPNKFVTLFLGELERHTGQVVYVNAGHNPPFVAKRAGGTETLRSGGVPLGLLPGARFRLDGVTIEPGDLLCLYSDGVTECAAPDDDEFGLERLIELVSARRQQPLAEIVAAIDRETTRFARGLPQADDQTVVLIRRCAEPS